MGNNFLIKDVFYLKSHCCITQEIVLLKRLGCIFFSYFIYSRVYVSVTYFKVANLA